MKEVLEDLWQLLRDYTKQETIDPLKMLGRFLGWGLAGSITLCLGLGFCALAIIRALQTETGDHLTGSLTWVPYFVAFVFTGIAAYLSFLTIKRPFQAKETPA